VLRGRQLRHHPVAASFEACPCRLVRVAVLADHLQICWYTGAGVLLPVAAPAREAPLPAKHCCRLLLLRAVLLGAGEEVLPR
jgi:hypothetical protein